MSTGFSEFPTQTLFLPMIVQDYSIIEGMSMTIIVSIIMYNTIDNYVYCIDNYVQSIDNNVFEKSHRQVYDRLNNDIDLSRTINNHRHSPFHSIK